MTTEYTLGLAFAHTSDGLPVVLLIQKGEGRPHAGCWNGLGGKLHPGEQLAHGMNREFREESGIDVAPADWLYFGILEGIGWRVHLFAHQMAPEKSLDLGLYAHRKHAGSKEPTSLQDMIVGKDANPLYDPDMHDWLHRELLRLDDRSRWILQQRSLKRSLKECGLELGITKERVRQIEFLAVKQLRERAGVRSA